MGQKRITVEVSCSAPSCYAMIVKSTSMSVSDIKGSVTAEFVILMRNEAAAENEKPLPFKCPVCGNTDPKKMKIIELK